MSLDDTIAALVTDILDTTAADAFHTGDDIPRIPHAPGWMPDIRPAALSARRERIAALRTRWAAVPIGEASPEQQVRHRLAGAIVNRAHWDLTVTRNIERNALALYGQILGPFYDLLLPLPPFDEARQDALVRVLAAVPGRVAIAREHLAVSGLRDLALAAVADLDGIGERLTTAATALVPFLDAPRRDAFTAAAASAAAALEGWREWLQDAAPGLAAGEPVGREKFVWFLRAVALVPDEPEDLVRVARADLNRAVVWELLSRNRHRDVPPAALFDSIGDQVAREAAQESQIREFYEGEGLLSQPESLRRYLVAEMPPWIEALRSLGVPDDLTDENRLDRDGVSYMPRPRPGLPYFYAANAQDPRLGIIHEGAHYQQLALSWASADPLRRRYIDSSANEGVAHYNEEMMLMAGLFEDAPHSQTVVHNFTRLRALRVIADVNLATGAFSLDDAVAHFVEHVPMDAGTAREESAMYLATPGLAMSYNVGKQQMLALVADAARAWGDEFSLRRIHDAVWTRGNTPFSVLRWELLGDRSALDAIDADLARLDF